MPTLVTVKILVFDRDGQSMPGFPLIRGPKNGTMATEAYTDKNGAFEFQASPNREIDIKLLSPDNRFNEQFSCKSGDTLKTYRITLKSAKPQYLSTTKLVRVSLYSKISIPHSSFNIRYQGKTGILTAVNGETEIQSIVGEPVELSYIFPDGKTRSKSIIYMAKRVNPNPLIITVDTLISSTNTATNRPNTPATIAPNTTDCTAKFQKISKIILRHEGGYVNDPSDSGGATNKGIAWNTWTAFAQTDLGLAPTLQNLKNLSDTQAEIIYRKRYWEPKGFCQISNDRVGLMVYDWTITSGGASKEIQKLLVNHYHQNIAIDGAMGPQTIQALNAVSDQIALLNAITNIRKNYYTALAFQANGAKTKNHKFLQGWLNRVDDCLKATL